MINSKKKTLLCCVFILYFYSVFSSNNVDTNQHSLAPFFPVENSYKNVLLCSFKKNIPLCLSKNDEPLCLLTKRVLTDSQKITYGFCLRGMVNNDQESPLVAIITSKPGIALNFELYYPLQTKPTTLTKSINMDPVSKEGILLKKISQDSTDFWFKRHYRTNIDGNFINASCSFFGPFFKDSQTPCCFFYTSLPDYQNDLSLNKNDSVKNYPPFSLFYYTLSKSGYSSYKPCYVAYTPFEDTLLLGYNNKYFALILATFFSYTQTNEKITFVTYSYTIKQLQKLKDYLNTIRNNNQKTITPYMPDPFCFNQQLHEILIHFLHTTKNSRVNRFFYKEVNRKINFLIRQKML